MRGQGGGEQHIFDVLLYQKWVAKVKKAVLGAS